MNDDIGRPSTAPIALFAGSSGLHFSDSTESSSNGDGNEVQSAGINMNSIRKRSRSYAKSLLSTKSLYMKTINPELHLQSPAENINEAQAPLPPVEKKLSAHDRFLVMRNVRTRVGTTLHC